MGLEFFGAHLLSTSFSKSPCVSVCACSALTDLARAGVRHIAHRPRPQAEESMATIKLPEDQVLRASDVR